MMLPRPTGLPPIALSATRVGRTDVGAGSATVDDDALTIVLGARGDEHPIRARLASIDALELSGDELSLALHDGTRITMVTPSATELRDDLLARCRTVPELTRTLRVFGSSRARRAHRDLRASEADEQRRFFGPLIDARKKAVRELAPQHIVAAFDASALEQSLLDVVRQFAAERHVEAGPARRALEAELDDAAEPLAHALRELGRASRVLCDALDDVRAWREWASQLRVTFETADRVWLALDSALDGVGSQP